MQAVLDLLYDLFGNVLSFTWQQGVMIAIGAILVFLAIAKEMEPTLLLPMGFGAILVNLPGVEAKAISVLAEFGLTHEFGELFPPAAVHRHRRDDRFRSPSVQPQDVPLRRCCPVRYLLHSGRRCHDGL